MDGYKVTLKDTTATVLQMRPRLYKGIYSRIARKLGVSRSHVRQVGEGKKRSRRIELALTAECRRIERQIEKFAGENVA